MVIMVLAEFGRIWQILRILRILRILQNVTGHPRDTLRAPTCFHYNMSTICLQYVCNMSAIYLQYICNICNIYIYKMSWGPHLPFSPNYIIFKYLKKNPLSLLLYKVVLDYTINKYEIFFIQ